MKEVLIRERNPAEVYHFHVANALLFHTLLNCVFMFSSVTQLCPTLCNPINCSTPGPLSYTVSRSLPKLMSIESVMPFNHLTLCHPFLLLPSIFPSIRVFSNELAL